MWWQWQCTPLEPLVVQREWHFVVISRMQDLIRVYDVMHVRVKSCVILQVNGVPTTEC